MAHLSIERCCAVLVCATPMFLGPATSMAEQAAGSTESSLATNPLVWIGVVVGVLAAVLLVPLVRRMALAAKPRSD